ncbi:MAG TPA: response regulator [Polyangiaceae bacterium]|nr:response regulator [Polyangiaceae bacterium]
MSTLLIVDDNPVDREVVERLLGGAYQYLCASSGGEGLELCRRERPKCVLLDYRLPDCDGVRLLPHFLEQQVGVIMITGVGDESIAVLSLKSGAHDYLSKNELTRENLERAVRNASEKARLMQEVALHHRLVNVMPIGVAVFDWEDQGDIGALRLVWRNAAASRSSTIGAEDVNRTIREVLPEVLDTVLPQLIADTIVTGSPRTLPEALMMGGIYTIKTVPLGGTLAAVLFEDITSERNAIEERRKMELQMRAAQRLEAVGRLAGGVAHDFNNVLSVVQSYAQFVRDRVAGDQVATDDVDVILDAAKRAAKLTAQLLAFGRGQVQSLRVMSLNDIVADVQRLLQRLIGEDVDLAVHLEPNLPPVEVDPTHMEQVLVNLVVNARDAMPRGGKLTIETGRVTLDESFGAPPGVRVPPGDYVALVVSDTGHGMDEETQQHVFEPFFTTKLKEGGTGLGLSTVFGIVKQCGGFIWVYSEPGEGTSFKVHLPVVSQPLTSAVASKVAPQSLAGTETVLVVEDEEMVRKAVCRLLRDAGYTVLEAANAEEARRIARTHYGAIELVLTDIVMPDVSGPDLAREIGGVHPDAQVVYMSGYTGHAMVHRARVGEGATFLQKPFSSEQLLGKLRLALDQSPD